MTGLEETREKRGRAEALEEMVRDLGKMEGRWRAEDAAAMKKKKKKKGMKVKIRCEEEKDDGKGRARMGFLWIFEQVEWFAENPSAFNLIIKGTEIFI